METPITVQNGGLPGKKGAKGQLRAVFLHYIGPWYSVICMDGAIVVASGTRATATSVCVKWLENRNLPLESHGSPQISTYPTNARFKSGDAADITVAPNIAAGETPREGWYYG